MLTPPERSLRLLLRVLALLFAVAAAGVVVAGLVPPLRRNPNYPLAVPVAAAGLGVMAMLAWVGAADVRRHRTCAVLLACAQAIVALAAAVMLARGGLHEPVRLAGRTVGSGAVLWAVLAAHGALWGVLAVVSARAQRARFGLKYFSPLQFRALAALAEALIEGEEEQVPPEDIARNVDRYLAGFGGTKKNLSRLIFAGLELYPLLTLRPPLSALSPADRRAFLEKRFYMDLNRRRLPAPLHALRLGAIRIANQFTFIGYYNDPRTWPSIGYVPFSRRADREERLRTIPAPPQYPPLRVTQPHDVRGDTMTADVVVVGTGAAASILAYGLARAGRDVLMLERGGYQDPRTFSEDQMEMFGRLYADGAFQLTRDFRFAVVQGSCVGGTTVINHAVDFDLPPEILARWNEKYGAGVDPATFADAQREVRDLIRVIHQQHGHMNPGGELVLEAARRLGMDDPPGSIGRVSANIDGCLGCGYCNIGCAYGRKLSMLDTILPRSQHEHNRDGREGVRIVSGCEVTHLPAAGARVKEAVCRLADGRTLRVRGNTFVVAAGAVSSSLVLQRSRLGGPRVGRGLAFNLSAPVSGVFPQVLNAYDGMQVAHYVTPPAGEGFVLETWYNAPVIQAIAMPGWFADHFKNMRRYNRMVSVGVLVGSAPSGVLKPGGPLGRDIHWNATREELEKVFRGVETAGRILFEAGAELVLPHTFQYTEWSRPEQLREIRTLVRDDGDLTLGTGHPQGGNALSQGPAEGVVNPEFRVHGTDNLFVCDASVFPDGIGINPQLPIMALANYAVPFIAANRPPAAPAPSVQPRA